MFQISKFQKKFSFREIKGYITGIVKPLDPQNKTKQKREEAPEITVIHVYRYSPPPIFPAHPKG